MKTFMSRRAVFAASVFAVLATSNCGGGNIPKTVGVAAGNISGVAVKGPVVAGVVKVLKMSATMERGAELASGTTDAAGAFSLPLPIYNGPLLVVVSSGTYTEEAIGLGVKLDGHELTALVPDYKGGTKLDGVRATPISTVAVAFTSFHVTHDGKPVVAAYNEAILHLHKQFGDIDWTAVFPADISVPGVTNLSPEAKAGLVLSGLSWESKAQAEASGVTAGLSLNAATLMTALVKDASDGTLDGKAGADFIKQGSVTLTGSATRVDLVQGITGFVNSTRNASSLTLADIAGFVAGIGGSNDAYLYCPHQAQSPECGSGVVDTTTPVVTWQLPLHDNAGVAGSVSLRVVAEDETGLKSFQFTAPASLKDVVATIDGKRAVLNVAFDVSSLPDGPVSIRAEATDTSGNPSAKIITVVVSNKGPIITISAPGEGALVKNTVVVTASAQAQSVGGVITRLALSDAPMGLGQDTLAAADSFSSQWDSTLSLEGSVTLTFRATDSFNTTTEKSVTVNVDNVPAGIVTASLSAGAPVSGAIVRLIAIDDTTGLPTNSRGGVGGAELGLSMPTDARGQTTFRLTGENWDGPVQLLASGAALSFVDPSDGVTPISVPSTYKFSSFRAHYKTGDTLSAPITLWTGLADAAAIAYAQGKNPSAPSPRSLKDALTVTDPLFAGHVSRPTSWDLRSVNPVPLTTGPTQSLRDVVYAAAPDVSLSALARALSIRASVTPGGVITAVTLATQLGEDLRSDGQLDGKALGAQLATAGSPSYSLDANTTRFQQAISLDAFIRSTNNATGLTKADILAGGLYDNISTDVSLLYPASQPPIPFDNAPPSVTFNVTYRQNNSDATPVGLSRLVRGTVTVTAVATDVSGVSSMTVTSSSGALTSLGGSLGTFKGAILTSTDGALVFTASVTDGLGNIGVSTFQVMVDNTAPVVAIGNPSATTFYSTSVPIDVTASDENGISSIQQSGLTNLTDVDLSSGRFAGSWTVPSAQTDGAVMAQFVACDLVGNCATQLASTSIDRTPPSVAWVVAPPAWSNATAASVTLLATDLGGAGVTAAWVQAGSRPPVALSFDGTNWVGTLTWPTGLSTAVVAWAEDKAQSSNSGLTRAAPYQQQFTIRRDTASPVITNVSSPGYFDERAMALQTDASGDAIFPASYTFPTHPARTVLGVPTVIYKASTRLSGGVISPSEINGDNFGNVPFLRFSVDFDQAVDAPITGASFSVTSAAGAATGDLIASSVAITGKALFELALTKENLPFLANGNIAAIPMTITISAKDSAKNEGTLTNQAVTFSVIAPPISVRRSNAPAVVDSTATGSSLGNLPGYVGYYFAGVTSSRYDKLYQSGTQWQVDSLVAVAEQVITNPHSTPLKIQLSQPTTLLLLTTEKWANRNWPYPCSTDPFTTGNPDPPPGTTCEELSPPLFSTPTARAGVATNSQTPLALDVVTPTPVATASTAVTIQAYDAVTLARIEIAEGSLVIPAATSTTPTKILMRFGRPGPWSRVAPNLAPLANSANCNSGLAYPCKWTDASQIFVRKDGFIWDQPTFYPQAGFKHIAEWILALSSIDESLSGQLRYSVSSLVAGNPASVRRDVDWNFSEVISH